jgi:hypothetical protein
MEAKEKAIELVEKYSLITGDKIYNYRYSKQCALICVDKIIETIRFMAESEEIDKLPFWQEVKEEIQKL